MPERPVVRRISGTLLQLGMGNLPAERINAPNIFLSPLCDIYKDMVDSYIIELKYCKTNTADEQLQVLFKEASAQICRYANSDIVKESVKTTKLHKLVVIYRGAEMVMCEEVTEE